MTSDNYLFFFAVFVASGLFFGFSEQRHSTGASEQAQWTGPRG